MPRSRSICVARKTASTACTPPSAPPSPTPTGASSSMHWAKSSTSRPDASSLISHLSSLIAYLSSLISRYHPPSMHTSTHPPSDAHRVAGILLHPTSLPERYGVGDLGDHVVSFLDWAAAAGMKVWQVLPLNPP